MEDLIVPLAAAVFLFPILFMVAPPAVSAWRRRHEVRRGFKPGPRTPNAILIPPADETAACVQRFRAAVSHSDLSDYLKS